MAIRWRAESRTRSLGARRLECLEDRRLLSLLGPVAADEVPTGRLLDQTVIVSTSTPTKSAAAAPSTLNTTNLTNSPLQPVDQALSNSDAENTISTAVLGVPPDPLSPQRVRIKALPAPCKPRPGQWVKLGFHRT